MFSNVVALDHRQNARDYDQMDCIFTIFRVKYQVRILRMIQLKSLLFFWIEALLKLFDTCTLLMARFVK